MKPKLCPSCPWTKEHMFPIEPQVTLLRKLAQVFLQALGYLWTGLLGGVWHFVSVVDAVFWSIVHFSISLGTVLGLLDRLVHLRLEMFLDVNVHDPPHNVAQDTNSLETRADLEGRSEQQLHQNYEGLTSGALLPNEELSCLDTLSEYSSLTSEEETVDSDWTGDEEDELSDDDPEANAELWESFLCKDDPYNPLNFCSPTVGKGRGRLVNIALGPPAIVEAKRGQRRDSECTEISQDKKAHLKKVRFSDEVEVRPLAVWKFASRATRDGSCWLEMARDRDRFRRRIQAVGEALGPCLLEQHRAQVWRKMQS